MPRQSFGQSIINTKKIIRLKKQKDIHEKRKKLLQNNLKKRKNKNKLD